MTQGLRENSVNAYRPPFPPPHLKAAFDRRANLKTPRGWMIILSQAAILALALIFTVIGLQILGILMLVAAAVLLWTWLSRQFRRGWAKFKGKKQPQFEQNLPTATAQRLNQFQGSLSEFFQKQTVQKGPPEPKHSTEY
ncbi:MAG: hypothetical protein DWQ01_01175 [Planctomycetota bacterium]|nr:MAG: hypothetical protein DWQ01_01175 [Planctomycetota bacterium]